MDFVKMALKLSILKTLVYADIFDSPLSLNEIWKFLIHNKRVELSFVEKTLKKPNKNITSEKTFYCLKNRTSIINKRVNSHKYNKEKIKIAQKICSYLFKLPTVMLIGISGGVAMFNAEKYDDIDLFIITRKNTLWLTRLLLLLMLDFLSVRRKRLDTKVVNKICLNMLIDESALKFKKEKQNIYIAHEIVQLLPLYQREDAHRKFLLSNKWIGKFLPNTFPDTGYQIPDTGGKNLLLITCLLLPFEFIARSLQLWYMRRHKSTEYISNNVLAFHPNDYTNVVIKLYKERLKKYAKI